MFIRYKLAAIKLVTPSREHLEKHYADLSDKPFFKGLITCTYSYPSTPPRNEGWVAWVKSSNASLNRYAERPHLCHGLGRPWRRQDRSQYVGIANLNGRLLYTKTYPLTALLGATNPLASAPGTIRGDFAIVRKSKSRREWRWGITLTVYQDVGRNVCHGSDSVENAKKEIALWFAKGEVVEYKQSQFDWIYEKP